MSERDRFSSSLRDLVRAMIPELPYLGVHEYRVISGTVTTGFSLQSTIAAMPDLVGVKFYAGGSVGTVFLPGATVLVGFVGADPSRPVILNDGAVVRHGDPLVGVTTGAYVVQKAVLP